MLIILLLLGTFTTEVSESMGKRAVHKHLESIYSMGFLGYFWSIFFLGLTVVFGAEFVFRMESLPFFALRVVLEILLAYVCVKAVATAERTTVAFLQTFTIPLLLIADFSLGYNLLSSHWIGTLLIMAALVMLFYHNPIGKKGGGYALASAVLAVATSSLYKYNITHFNSVAAEQILVILFLLVYFVIASRLLTHEYPFKLLLKPYSGTQSLSAGAGAALVSFAYLFAPASIVIAAKRALEVVFSFIFGRRYFHEGQLLRKVPALIVIIAGLVFIGMG